MSTPDKTRAELLAYVVGAAIALQKFHPDAHAQAGGGIVTQGLGLLLTEILGADAALDLLEASYEILNKGPLKGTGIRVTTQRKLTTDAHSTTEGVLAGLRARGLI